MTIQERKDCRNSRTVQTKALLKFRIAEYKIVCLFTPSSGFFKHSCPKMTIPVIANFYFVVWDPLLMEVVGVYGEGSCCKQLTH